MVGAHGKGKVIIQELGKYRGKKIITYEMTDFIGGMRRIPRTSKGTFEMQDIKVTSTKHFKICRLLGRKGKGFVIMKQMTENGIKLYGWTITEGRMKVIKEEDIGRFASLETLGKPAPVSQPASLLSEPDLTSVGVSQIQNGT
jgi:hypothetical protein